MSSSDQRSVRYRLAPAIRVSFTDDGATVLDTVRGSIIAMNRAAAELLRAIQDGASTDALYRVLAGLDGAPSPENVDADLRTFLDGSLAANLIVEQAS